MQNQLVACPSCSSQNNANAGRCTNCGFILPVAPMPMQQMGGMPGQKPVGSEKKLAAGLCGILLNGLGVHKFILGYTTEGIIMLVTYIVGLFLCGIPSLVVAIIGIIEGIMYLTKSDEEFSQTYIVNKKGWF
jgi:TM2 domain-containing membrane protein YozV